MRTLAIIGGAAAILGVGFSAQAQSNVSVGAKFSWSENAGWMNWRDANSGAQGVRFYGTCLGGFIWGENIGWINVGDGTPSNGSRYANVNGTDFGVNIAASGELSGFAWGENIGWINFGGGALATPAQPARIDFAARRLRGYAWAENIGWINLDVASDANGKFVGVCRADVNADGSVDINDFFAYLTVYAGNVVLEADFTGDGAVDINDFFAFLTQYASGC